MRRRSAFVVLGLLALAPPACSFGPGPPGDWEPAPQSPLSPRESATAVWTGEEVLVFGGDDSTPYCPSNAICAGPDEPALADGAAFDPATGTWRSMADAPVPLEWPTATVADGQVYAWNEASGRPGDREAFLHYDPQNDRWDEPERPPVDAGTAVGLAGGDHGLVAWAEVPGASRWSAWMFDAETETWTELPPDPLQPSGYREMVWIDDELVLIDQPPSEDPDAGPQFYRAAVLDPVDQAWRRLPDQEVIATGTTRWLGVGARVVNPAFGERENAEWPEPWARSYPGGGRLDLAADPALGEATWEALPDRPEESDGWEEPALPWTAGERFVTVGHWIFDNDLDQWLEQDAPDGFPDQGMTAVWTGDEQLFVWGGADVDDDQSNHELLNRGWLWTGPGIDE
jgi:hypothetical protein